MLDRPQQSSWCCPWWSSTHIRTNFAKQNHPTINACYCCQFSTNELILTSLRNLYRNTLTALGVLGVPHLAPVGTHHTEPSDEGRRSNVGAALHMPYYTVPKNTLMALGVLVCRVGRTSFIRGKSHRFLALPCLNSLTRQIKNHVSRAIDSTTKIHNTGLQYVGTCTLLQLGYLV